MQRSSVVLPEPLGPITTTTSPVLTESETPRSTSSAPNRLCTLSITSIARWLATTRSVTVEDASFKIPAIERQSVTDAEVDGAGAHEDLEWRQRAFDDFPACHRQLPQTHDGNQRRCLHQADAKADERRRGEPQCLRNYDDLQHQAARHAKASRGVPLCAGQ